MNGRCRGATMCNSGCALSLRPGTPCRLVIRGRRAGRRRLTAMRMGGRSGWMRWWLCGWLLVATGLELPGPAGTLGPRPGGDCAAGDDEHRVLARQHGLPGQLRGDVPAGRPSDGSGRHAVRHGTVGGALVGRQRPARRRAQRLAARRLPVPPGDGRGGLLPGGREGRCRDVPKARAGAGDGCRDRRGEPRGRRGPPAHSLAGEVPGLAGAIRGLRADRCGLGRVVVGPHPRVQAPRSAGDGRDRRGSGPGPPWLPCSGAPTSGRWRWCGSSSTRCFTSTCSGSRSTSSRCAGCRSRGRASLRGSRSWHWGSPTSPAAGSPTG